MPVLERRDTARGEEGCEQRIDEGIDLGDTHPDHAGDHQCAHVAEPWVVQRDAEARDDPLLQERRHLDCELQQPADHDAGGEAKDRAFRIGPESRADDEHRADHAEVHDDRGERGRREAMKRVQRRHRQRCEADEQEIREEHLGELDRKLGLAGNLAESGGHHRDQIRSDEDPDQAHDGKDDREHTGAVEDEALPLVLLALLHRLGEYRHEGGRERSLGE
jgi:hypothetical protein